MRWLITIVACFAAAAAIGVLSGCGGASTATGAQATSSVSKAEATTYAHAVNLQPADLPGAKVTSPEAEAPQEGQAGSEADRCAGAPDPALTVAKIHSATFTEVGQPEHEQVRSLVEVWPSTATAAQNNAANRSRRALACAEQLASRLFADQTTGRVHYGHVTVSRLPSPLPGLPGAFAVRFAVAIVGVPTAIEATRPHLYVDTYGFLSGQAEVNLLATGFPKPVPAEADKKLLAVLYSRAQANKL